MSAGEVGRRGGDRGDCSAEALPEPGRQQWLLGAQLQHHKRVGVPQQNLQSKQWEGLFVFILLIGTT